MTTKTTLTTTFPFVFFCSLILHSQNTEAETALMPSVEFVKAKAKYATLNLADSITLYTLKPPFRRTPIEIITNSDSWLDIHPEHDGTQNGLLVRGGRMVINFDEMSVVVTSPQILLPDLSLEELKVDKLHIKLEKGRDNSYHVKNMSATGNAYLQFNAEDK